MEHLYSNTMTNKSDLRKDELTEDKLYVAELDEYVPLDQVRAIARAYSRVMGGKTKLSEEERKNRAAAASKARWSKRPDKK